ncbi:MAG TPA: carbohydrate kinase family protein [Candidatus Sulfotelmatobacter sp.]|nr:carbohydrate kinase family protein [Candidatus Sulfotelmatobacter sp.]
MKSATDELTNLLNNIPNDIHVAVMPDFFLDRLITLNQAPSEFAKNLLDIAGRKGGSIDGIPEMDIRGGNAVNTASALAMLGVKVTPIICTSRLGLHLLNFHLKPLNVDLTHVKVMDRASLTTALELTSAGGKVNVMVRDLGSLESFGPADLSDADYEVIRTADYICVYNWAGTKKYGTELAQKIFRIVKADGKGKTYFDTADPIPNREEIPQLMEKVLKTKDIDVLSINENEAITYASYLTGEFTGHVDILNLDNLALESARVIAGSLSARIDLHTTTFSASFTNQDEKLVPAFRVPTLRATGAGDAWNAGNIFADLCGLSDEHRLTLANAVSACYLTDRDGMHPTRRRLLHFLEQQKA